MKKPLLATLILSVSFSSFAGLFDHTVFTRDGITAECSDYLGKVSSGGPITLRDFMIDDSSGAPGCALNSADKVTFLRGKVLRDINSYGCISSKKLNQGQVSYARDVKTNVDTASLTNELSDFSARLSSGGIPRSRSINVELPTSQIVLKGSSSEILIVNVMGRNPVIIDTNVTIQGDITPDQIIWHFPEATSLSITRSGMSPEELGFNVGMPGTFVAPNAEVFFQNALITGSLYARKLTGLADREDCSGLVSGQINAAPLKMPKHK